VAKIGVREVRVEAAAEVPAPIVENTKGNVRQHLATCATGPEPHIVEVRIDNFKEANPAAVVLVGDTASLAGQVRVIKASDGTIVGEYYVQELMLGMGLIGLAITANADTRLPPAFAKRICERVFKRPSTVQG